MSRFLLSILSILFSVLFAVVANSQPSALMVQPPGGTPIPLLADNDAQGYMAAAGISTSKTITPTVAASVHAAGTCIGGVQAITNAARSVNVDSGIVYNIAITDASHVFNGADILFFSSNPTTSAFTDAAACTVAAADIPKYIGHVHIVDTIVQANVVMAVLTGANLSFVLGANITTLYAVAITKPQITTTVANGFTFTYRIMQD